MRASDIQAIIYHSGEFTKTVTINGVNVKALFLPEGMSITLGNGEAYVNRDRLYCVPSDVTGVNENDTVIIDGVTYYIVEIFKSNTSNAMPVELYLSKVQNYE